MEMENTMDKKFLSEMSWGDEEETQDTTEEAVPGAAAMSAKENIDFLNKLDDQFNNVYKEITSSNTEDLQLFSTKMQKMELSNFAKNLTKKLTPEIDENQERINDIMNSGQDDILKIFDDVSVHGNRKKMYDMYQEISNINSIAYRMLQVYLNNILVKNGQSKNFINVVENDYNPHTESLDENIKKSFIKFMKTMLLYFDIQEKMKNRIVPEMLKLGDYYIELVDLAPIDQILDTDISILQEDIDLKSADGRSGRNTGIALFENCTNIGDHKTRSGNPLANAAPTGFGDKMAKILLNKTDRNFTIEESDINFWTDVLNSEEDESKYGGYKEFNIENFQELDFDGIEDIYLRILPPTNVLKVEKDGNHYGFLIIEDIDEAIDPNNEIDMYQRFLRDDNSSGKNGKDKYHAQEEKLADALVDSISNKLAEIMSNDSGFISDMPDELKTSLRVIAYEKIRKKSKLKFRFLQSDKLINFHTSIDKYRPYGTSIFDPIVMPVKMYTIAMMSSVISRLSRASVMRKWNIEVGTKRNYPELVERVKKDLRTKSISYDNLNSIRSISQVMTDFRDIAVVSQNGQRFIDMELMPMHDRALPMNDMMDLRNELVAATGVPSVYLNIGDSIELRETLVNINIGFSHTISGLQGHIEDGLNELMNSIFDILLKKNAVSTDFKLSQFFRVTLNHPLVLQLQTNESVISTVSNIIGLLKQSEVKFDPMVLFKKYIPDFDWDMLQSSGEDAIKREIKEKLMQGSDQGGSY
jgi:putative NIF3 family GTP cyclohydrolase 1 type 2